MRVIRDTVIAVVLKYSKDSGNTLIMVFSSYSPSNSILIIALGALRNNGAPPRRFVTVRNTVNNEFLVSLANIMGIFPAYIRDVFYSKSKLGVVIVSHSYALPFSDSS
jgi:hypothetical protein